MEINKGLMVDFKPALLKFKNVIENVEIEFINENYYKGIEQIETAKETYNSIEFFNINEGEKDVNVIMQFVIDYYRIQLVIYNWLHCIQLMSELQVIKIREQITTKFDIKELDKLYRDLMGFLTHNEKVIENYQKYPTKLIKETQGEINQLIENIKAQKENSPKQLDSNSTNNVPQPIIKSPFSVLEWATIFYYANETNLLPESRLIKKRMEQFMSKHQLNTTFDSFKTKYYEAKKRINDKNDYPVNKLELIIPFLKVNYIQTVIKIENDITFLEEHKPEY